MILESIDQRNEIVAKRADNEASIRSTVDKAMRDADRESTTCGWVWPLLARLSGRGSSGATAAAAAAAAAMGAARSAAEAATAETSVFGQKKVSFAKKGGPHAKLAAAVETMSVRVGVLETKASLCRAEAQKLAVAGSKGQALRMLRRSKMFEKQSVAASASCDALEQQLEMLNDAEVNKEVVQALASSASGMKTHKKILARAERAVDESHELRDVAEDVGNSLGELRTSTDIGDDDLLDELDLLVAEASVSASQPQPSEDAPSVRAVAFPTAPKKEVAAVERLGLLASAS